MNITLQQIRHAMSAFRARSAYGGALRHASWTSSRLFGSGARGVTRVVGGGSAGGGQQKKQKQWQQKGGNGRRRRSWAQEGLSFVRDVTWLVCTCHCLKEYVAEPCLVRGPSMRPTIEHGSWLLVNKVSFPLRARPLGACGALQRTHTQQYVDCAHAHTPPQGRGTGAQKSHEVREPALRHWVTIPQDVRMYCNSHLA